MTVRSQARAVCIVLLLNPAFVAAQSSTGQKPNGSQQNTPNSQNSNSQNSNTTPGNNPGNQQNSSPPAPSPGGSGQSNVFFESQKLGYAALDAIAGKIGDDICADVKTNPASSILIYDPATFSNLQYAAGFFTELHVLSLAFQSFLDNAPTLPGAAAAAGGVSAQQIASNTSDIAALKQEFQQLELLFSQLQAQVNQIRTNPPAGAAPATGDKQPKLGVALTAAESVLSALGPYITTSRTDTSTTFTITDAAIAMNVTRYVTSCAPKTAVIYPRIAMPEGDKNVWDTSTMGTTGNILKTLFDAQRHAALLMQAYEDAWSVQQTQIQEAAALKQAQDQEVLTVQQAKDLAAIQQPQQPAAPAAPVQPGTPAPKAVGGGGQNPQTPQGAQTQNAGAPPSPQLQTQTPAAALAAKTYLGSDYLALAGASGLLNSFLSAYTQTATGATVPQIVQLGQALTLLSALVQPNTDILFLEATAAGGTQRISKNLLRNLFWGPAIDYSGGAIVSYGLIDVKSARVSASGVYQVLTPYTTIKAPKKIEGLRDGDNLHK